MTLVKMMQNIQIGEGKKLDRLKSLAKTIVNTGKKGVPSPKSLAKAYAAALALGSLYYGTKALPTVIKVAKNEQRIKKEWKDNGIAASTAGTKMHYDIECYYNDQDVEIDLDCVEWDYFMEFEDEMGHHMNPYRTEWMIWDNELKFAGSIDMLFENPDGTLEI